MDENLYDEFGNYIGPEIASDEEDEEEEQEEQEGEVGGREMIMGDEEDEEEAEADNEGAIILAEDKKYYPTAMEVYGEEVETLVEDEDAQPLEEPIIKPTRVVKMEVGKFNQVEPLMPLRSSRT